MSLSHVLQVIVWLQVVTFLCSAPIFWKLGNPRFAVAELLLAGVQAVVYL